MVAIYELSQVLWFNTPLGLGQALLVIDYGCHENSIWVIAIKKNGNIKHFNSNQISLSENNTLELNIKKK
jgi:hypothetical protein